MIGLQFVFDPKYSKCFGSFINEDAVKGRYEIAIVGQRCIEIMFEEGE